jgi:hypothetical protein
MQAAWYDEAYENTNLNQYLSLIGEKGGKKTLKKYGKKPF